MVTGPSIRFLGQSTRYWHLDEAPHGNMSDAWITAMLAKELDELGLHEQSNFSSYACLSFISYIRAQRYILLRLNKTKADKKHSSVKSPLLKRRRRALIAVNRKYVATIR